MDFVIVFFRDVLNGPLYYVVAVINSILICSCIGYLGERYLNEKKLRLEHAATHAALANNVNGEGDDQAQREGIPGSQDQSLTTEVAEEIVKQAVNPTEAKEEVVSNENVVYNSTTISSDELLDDDY